MAIFKCKMCGGTLEINNNETVVTCEYCNTQQTLPKLDNDRRINMYDRANHFRRNNEFDKAMGIYEQILNEDNTDSEAYWSLVLCRYGIEYVEDPSSHKRIPTVNRAQFTSIFDDDNYKSALQYADSYQRSIYETEARVINEIQKGILDISQKEEPFDVFICYKETDNSGRRTMDSVLANDLYHLLTQEGYKVFFSRITLEDKLGVAYEPYIFAALNSSKVMVVLGTKPEYFNAVWVKNEWSRYLGLIKNGAKKVLIPAYKDMDPYDLPEEFSHLQAQDMSKLGFMQDLIRGIKKITEIEKVKEPVTEKGVVSNGNTKTAPLLKRAFMFLEDGEWDSADEYCEKVLDIDPECAEAYLGKLMAELYVEKQENLIDCDNPFDDYNNYQKAIRFADDKLKKDLEGYIDFITNRNLTQAYNDAILAMNSANTEEAYKRASVKFKELHNFKDSKELAKQCLDRAEETRLTQLYNSAVSAMNSANTEQQYKSVAKQFNEIKGYRDSEDKANLCLENAEIERKNAIFSEGKSKMTGEVISNYEIAIKLFESISGWKDTDEEIANCKQRIKEIKAKEEFNRKEAERRAKRNKKIAIITTSIVFAIIAFMIVLNSVIIPNGKYNDAIALMDAGNTVEAYEALRALDGYKDSEEKASSIFSKYFVEKNKNIKVGEHITFGAYEQDNNVENGKEDIEWLVLEIENGKALLISKYALDCKQYNYTNSRVTWETCSLRKWLNHEFLIQAFDSEEKERILTTTVSADKNREYDTNPGNVTKDKVFLLSVYEANKYFDSDKARQCKPTDYAVNNGAYAYSENGNCWWWLRSPGRSQNRAAGVSNDGSILEIGSPVYSALDAVRPALWIDLNS